MRLRKIPFFVLVPLLLLGLGLIQQQNRPVVTRSVGLADAFDFPFEPDGGERPPWYASYDVQNPYLTSHSRCYDTTVSQLRHAGEDWFRPGGSEVHAIANGRVVYLVPDWDHGDAIVIEHPLKEGWQTPWGDEVVYSLYLHLDSEVQEGEQVARGQVIGHLQPWEYNSHLHLEIRRYADMAVALRCPASGKTWLVGPSYVDEAKSPYSYGYLNPQEWIESHR
ncbi:MAG: M23 family metallopeptidase [Ardenticatenales bacterium]|nr:M23 family metallopeptidase [Ardenticatenales bacterium]